MRISTKDWLNYIEKMRKLNDTAADLMQEYVRKNGFSDTQAVIDYAYALVTKYGEGSAELAAEMYEAIAEAQGVTIPPAVPAKTSSYGDVAKAINGSLLQSPDGKKLTQVVGRHVKLPGADTMLKNAIRDGAEFAWVPFGDTCAFCITLASRGWQKISKKALKKGHAEHIHAHCDCQYCVRFDGKSNVAGYNPDVYRKMYYGAYSGEYVNENMSRSKSSNVSKDQINALRRQLAAEKKEQENEKYIDVDINSIAFGKTKTLPVKELSEYVVDGTKYFVDGTNVIQNNSPREIEVANILVKNLGGELLFVPEVKGKYKGVHTPDYIYNGERWDLKELKNGTSKYLIRDIIHKKKSQSENFIFDITESKLPYDEILSQAQGVFENFNNKHAKTVMIIKEDKILKIFKRK